MTCQELQNFKNQLAQSKATLVAVSKTQSFDAINALYACGQRIFGENRAQELLEKQAHFQALGYRDIAWHFIGHLQRNKVKYIAPFVSLIHSVDSLDLLKEINKEAKKNNRVIDCLLQFYIAEEETKFGLNWAEAEILMQTIQSSATAKNWQNVRIVGIMGMASQSSDKAKVAAEFAQLKQYFIALKQDFLANTPEFKEISMGMSGDYPLALAAGSSLVRIGTMLFA
jgi:pyridoxal phosphate enzyme (YggS family)